MLPRIRSGREFHLIVGSPSNPPGTWTHEPSNATKLRYGGVKPLCETRRVVSVLIRVRSDSVARGWWK